MPSSWLSGGGGILLERVYLGSTQAQEELDRLIADGYYVADAGFFPSKLYLKWRSSDEWRKREERTQKARKQ